MRTDPNKLILSAIINREDSFNKKARNVKTILQRLCQESGLGLLDNSSILRQGGRGKFGGIHLNEGGSQILRQNFTEIINV